jgi:hypothetical protein
LDSERFDVVVQTLSSTGSRRGLLRILAGVTLLGLLTALPEPAATIARRRTTRHRHQAQPPHQHSTKTKTRTHAPHQRHAQHQANQDAHS